MVRISFLGGCREVGRSAILIESSNSREKCILDYGIRFRGEDRLPYKPNLDNLKAIALTHCHIDHSGALPYLYKTISAPLYTNSATLALTEVLVNDMIRISKSPYPFGFRELNKVIENSHFLTNDSRQKISDNFYITFILINLKSITDGEFKHNVQTELDSLKKQEESSYNEIENIFLTKL